MYGAVPSQADYTLWSEHCTCPGSRSSRSLKTTNIFWLDRLYDYFINILIFVVSCQAILFPIMEGFAIELQIYTL